MMFGGNLFKAGRVSKERYNEIVASLIPVLDKHFGNAYRIPVAYREKIDYGDVDIILDAGYVQNNLTWERELFDDLGIEGLYDVHRVRNVVSMLYMNFQVDIFLVGSRRLESTYNFMSYNILGNLVGRLYHKFNLRYGEDGLFYVLRGFNNHISKEISVTRDMEKMLTFVGLSYERWKQGFDNLQQIFDYVISSKYFCSNSYDEKYFNVQKRATERPDFLKFLDYLKENSIDKNYPFDRNKDIYLDEIDEFFRTDLKTANAEHKAKQLVIEEVSKKFNGKIVMEILGVDGGEKLGKFIGSYKNSKDDKFNEFILASTEKEIETDILNYWHGNLLNE